MVIGVVYHAIQMGLEGRGDNFHDPFLSNILFVMHSWRMPVFFLMSGFFTQLLLQRRGVSATLRNRFQRVTLPFLVALVLILPINSLFIHGYSELAEGGVSSVWNFSFLSESFFYWLRKPRFHHLWFLFYLSGFVAVIGAAAFLVRKRTKDLLPIPVKSLLLLVTMFGCLYFMKNTFEVDAPTRVYYRPLTFWYYYCFFALGSLLFKSYYQAKRWKFVGLPTAAIYFVLSSVLIVFALGSASKLIQAIGMLAFATAGCVLMLSLFAKYCDIENSKIRYLIASSYWVYLAHEPLLHILGVGFKTYQWNLYGEISFLIVATYLLSFASYTYLVRGSWVDRLLNGEQTKAQLEAQPIAG
jgi:glucan biosynthesis protein C